MPCFYDKKKRTQERVFVVYLTLAGVAVVTDTVAFGIYRVTHEKTLSPFSLD